jgi:hypothetical protein
MKYFILFGHIATLVFGTLIYMAFRCENLIVFSWLDKLYLTKAVYQLRFYTDTLNIILPNWFLFSLPDGLWVFSYVSFILYIWNNKLNSQNIFWILFIPFIAIVLEFGQYFKIISGTFDLNDLIFYSLGTVLPIFIFNLLFNFKFLKQ